MKAPDHAGIRVDRAFMGRKYEFPRPLVLRARVFSHQRIGQFNVTVALREITLMQRFNSHEMCLQRLDMVARVAELGVI